LAVVLQAQAFDQKSALHQATMLEPVQNLELQLNQELKRHLAKKSGLVLLLKLYQVLL
jgi:hypothetical protein